MATSILFTYEAFSQTAPNAQYAELTPGVGLTGTGTFNCAGMPDFNYSITGDFAPGDTSIPGPPQTVDNVGGGFETIFGPADMEDNIEVEVAGFFGAIGSPISNTVVTTLDFVAPTTPGELSFLIADVEQDQVQVCALDENGVPVPLSVINTWFVTSFDADNSDTNTIAPTWDPATGTLVGQEGNGVTQTNYQMDLPDNEAGAGFFTVTTSITQLVLKSQALGIAPDDPSQHFIFASTCQEFDLALVKEVVTPPSYAPGDDVTFDITVCNQGNVDAFNVEVTDNIPAGFTLSTADMNGWSGVLTGPVTQVISAIPVDGCETIQIDLTIDDDFMGTSIINNAEISDADDDMDSTNMPPTDVDSTPGDNSQPDDLADDDDLTETDGGDDEDPEEIVIDQTYDLALIKEEVGPGEYSPGDDVIYDITVCNQGTLDAANVELTDNIPAGMTLSGADMNGWSGSAAGPVTLVVASLPVDACETVQIILTIDDDFMGTSIINNAEISADDGDDVDSTPGDNSQPDDLADDDDLTETDGGDDEDPEEVLITQVYDLALIKTEVTSSPYSPGDDVTFQITVCNQGTLDAANVEITDNIPTGLTLSGADTNGWSGSAAGPVTNVIASLPVDACETLDIVMTIDPAFTGTSIINNAEISADDGDDVDSTPGDNSQPDDIADDNDLTETDGGDDEDPEEIIITPNIYDLALIKEETSTGPYGPGDDIMFTITVANQGNVDAGFITVSDVIPAGLSLSVADNNGWAGGPIGTVTNVISGPVAGGAPVTVDIVLTVDANAPSGMLVNNAEISSDNGDDVDSTPGDSSQPDDFADDDDLTETDGGDDEDPEQVEICNCDDTVDAGTMVYPPDSEGCIDDMGSTVTLITTPTGDAVIPPGYVMTYVLTINNTFDIIDCNDTPNIVVDIPGWFTIHPVVYDPNTFDPCSLIGSTIADMEALFASDPCVCGDVDPVGVEQGSYFCCLDMLQVDMKPMPPLLHDAAIGLMSKGTVDMPSSTTRLSGGQFVELQEGFESKLGSNFEAFIAPCAEEGN
jgi:uncharacterized repeat protein (TIGR01451 family)